MKIPNQLQTFQASLSKKQRIALLIVVAAVVLGLLTATVFRSNVVGILRWMTYSQADDNFAHNAQSNSLFLGMGDNLLICTQTQIQLFSPTGTSRIKESVDMKSPALNASGDYAVVYDVGGRELRVVGGETLLHSMTLSEEESILCATINEKGGKYAGLDRYEARKQIVADLEEQGYLEISSSEIVDGRARNYYAVTPAGRDYLRQTLAEYAEISVVFQQLMEDWAGHEA